MPVRCQHLPDFPQRPSKDPQWLQKRPGTSPNQFLPWSSGNPVRTGKDIRRVETHYASELLSAVCQSQAKNRLQPGFKPRCDSCCSSGPARVLRLGKTTGCSRPEKRNMSKTYDHRAIEARWQATGRAPPLSRQGRSFEAQILLLDCSLSFRIRTARRILRISATDIVSRYKACVALTCCIRWAGCLGLPAEQYAVKTGIHPPLPRRRTHGFNADETDRLLTIGNGKSARPTRILPVDSMIFCNFKRGSPMWLKCRSMVPRWDGAGERRDHRWKERSRGVRRHRRPMRQWVLKIRLRRPSVEDCPGRMAGEHPGDAKELIVVVGVDVEFRLADGTAPFEFSPRGPIRLWRDVYGAGARHPLVRSCRAGSSRPVTAYQEAAARKAISSARHWRKRKPAYSRRLRRESRQRRAAPIWIADYVLRAMAPAPLWPCRHMTHGTGPSRKLIRFPFAKSLQGATSRKRLRRERRRAGLNSDHPDGTFSIDGLRRWTPFQNFGVVAP